MSFNRVRFLNRLSIVQQAGGRWSAGNACNNHRQSSTGSDQKRLLTTKQKLDWNRTVSEAEEIVGYPTSFLSLRWLLSDEIANVAVHLRKLSGTTHPLLKIARDLLYNGKTNMQTWGLIILLLSKAAGHADHIPDVEHDKSAGVLHSQRILAEISEMFRIGHLIHQGVVNLQPLIQAGKDLSMHSDMTFGNKIALLSGDYVMSTSCVELARLKNQEVLELMTSSIRDLAESEFIGDRDERNNPLPSKPTPRKPTSEDVEGDDWVSSDVLKPMHKDGCMGIPDKEWTLRNILSAGSLLGKSCQGALKLAGQPEALQRCGYLFGKHFLLARQAHFELKPFQSNTLPLNDTFSLVSAPVLFHLDHDPTLYTEIQKGCVSTDNVDYEKVHSEVVKGPGVEKTLDLQRKHSSSAIKVLNQFPPSEARTALQNIIFAMEDLRT